jgi:hypothetical protein
MTRHLVYFLTTNVVEEHTLFIFYPEDGSDMFLRNSIITPKTAIDIITAVRTSSLV